MSKLLCLTAAAALIAASVSAEAKGSGSHSSQPTGKSSASTLRGSNGNSQKGGRYLAPAAKKLPGKKKPPPLTLKGGGFGGRYALSAEFREVRVLRTLQRSSEMRL